MLPPHVLVTLAQAGVQKKYNWIPAYAGMTKGVQLMRLSIDVFGIYYNS